jgi:hypothetical protein
MYMCNRITSLRKYSLLIVVCLCFLANKYVNAQQLSLNAGSSIPFSNYGKTDFPLFENGFAQNGTFASLQYEQAIKKSIGFYVGGNFNYNRINQADFTKLVKVGNKDVTNITSTSDWSQFSLMGGLKISRMNPGYAIYTKLGLGLSFMNSPGNNLILNDSVLLKWNSSSVAKEVFNWGLGFSIPINESIAFQMNADMVIAFPDFGIIKITDATGSSATNSNSSLQVPFKTFQIGAGIIFNLIPAKFK